MLLTIISRFIVVLKYHKVGELSIFLKKKKSRRKNIYYLGLSGP